MTDQKPKLPRYFVTLQGENYLAKDSKTDKTLFTSDAIPEGADLDSRATISAQAENFLNTLYPKWREAEAYW